MGNICNRLAAFEHRCFLIVLDTPKKHRCQVGDRDSDDKARAMSRDEASLKTGSCCLDSQTFSSIFPSPRVPVPNIRCNRHMGWVLDISKPSASSLFGDGLPSQKKTIHQSPGRSVFKTSTFYQNWIRLPHRMGPPVAFACRLNQWLKSMVCGRYN